MTHFYAAWTPKDNSPGRSAAAALKHAQAKIREAPKWRHPRFWAAWVLWGRGG